RLCRPPVFLELLHVPTAGDNQPRAWLHRARRVAYSTERFNDRCRANPVHLGTEAQAGAYRVKVRIDQAGNDGSTLKIDDPGFPICQLTHVGRRPDRKNPAATERERVGEGELT